MIYDFPQPTPMIMVLGTHFSRASDVIVPDYLTTDPSVLITQYRDGFGNWCSRIVAPTGRMRLAADGIVRDTGLPDVIVPLASIVEAVEVPGAGFLVVRPGRFLHAGKHHALVGSGRLPFGPDIPVAMGRLLRASRRLEPNVCVRGVIDDEVDDHADAPLLAAMRELDEIAESAITRIDAVIVRDVVAVVLAGRRLKRHQPDRGDAEPVQIIESPLQALEIAHSVPVRVHIGANGEAVDDTVFVPEIVDHRAGRRRLRAAISDGDG